MKLDQQLLSQFTEENYRLIFSNIIDSKTDVYTDEIKIPMGVDGLDYDTIKNNTNQISKSFCKRAINGKYIFSPFREIQIPKAPYTKNEFKEAKRANKLRTLSISTINDTIFQNMIYSTIYEYTENRYYKKLDNNIYGYRKGKSVILAIENIRKCINNGYTYGLDGDIEKYFDRINHQKLVSKIKKFYGNNLLLIKYLNRFINVKRVAVENKKKVTKYYTCKPITTNRELGIPQGGVLSGLLANIYLYNFDIYVNNNLSKLYDIRYFRYADDFIILCKTPTIIQDIYKRIHRYFRREKLNLHPIDTSAIDNTKSNNNKTKAINLYTQHYIDFLGFRISPTYVGIKGDNIIKFKKNISHIINTAIKQNEPFDRIIYKINSKIMGNAIFGKGIFVPCKKCNKPQKPQSWIGFFIGITDMRVLKKLDVWIRKQLFNTYKLLHSGDRLNKKYFKTIDKIIGKLHDPNSSLQSLFKIATDIKNWYKKYPNAEFCECQKFIPDYDIAIS